jgi:hypothetical protein
LPIGIQLYGNFCREDLLLKLAAQIERALVSRPGGRVRGRGDSSGAAVRNGRGR